MRSTDVMLIPVKCSIHLLYIKKQLGSVDNDNFKLTHGGQRDLPGSGLTGFVLFLYNTSHENGLDKKA